MTDERWEQVKSLIKDKFEVISDTIEPLPEEKGKGEVEIIEFQGPLGKCKLERTNQPLVLDKKTIGSKRIGSHTKVEYVYSDTEVIHKFFAYRWDEGKGIWEVMELERTPFFI